jgi:hypothetical protein
MLQATRRGDLKILLPMGKDQPTKATLQNVYYSPDFAFTLISVGTMDKKGYQINFDDGICTIRMPKPNRCTIGLITQTNRLYRVSIAPQGTTNSPEEALAASGKITISELHRRMGHINHEDLLKMVKEKTITRIDLDLESKPNFCPQCVEAKATNWPFLKLSISNRAKAYGDKVASDLCGPSPTASLKGKRYYIIFQDGFTQEQRVYFLSKKSEAFEIYKIYEAWVKTQRNGKIKIFGTDRGGEFTGAAFKAHLEKTGTIRHLTVHDSPQSNGKAERASCTIVEGATAMLQASKLPEYLWAEATSHLVWLHNRVPTKVLPNAKTPFEMATGTRPDLSSVREWGCPVWVKRTHSSKFGSKVNPGRFVGFDEESKCYRIYWTEKRTITVERNVYFDERSVSATETTLIEGENDIPANQQPKNGPKAVSPPKNIESPNNEHTVRQTINTTRKDDETASKRTNFEEDRSENGRATTLSNSPTQNTPQNTPNLDPATSQPIRHSDDEEEVEEELLGRRQRPGQPTGFYKDLLAGKVQKGGKATIATEHLEDSQALQANLDDEDLLLAGLMEEYTLMTGGEPQSLNEALSGSEADKWCAAVHAELDQIEKLGTWRIVEAPTGANIVSSKFVFRLKRDENGIVIKHKARLVARGFTQKFGIDYFDTGVWIVRWETLRNLLAQAASNGSIIHQADVKNAYLNAEMKEDVYIDLPPGYTLFRQLPPNPN